MSQNIAQQVTDNARDISSLGTNQESKSQHLTFKLADEIYGVDILRVQEIKGWTAVTAIPNTPDYMQGVLNLRGVIVPIIDMRKRFHIDSIDYTATTVVIVLSINTSDDSRLMGIVVDAVSDVINFKADDIKATPELNSKVDLKFLKGLGTFEEHIVMLLDVDKLFTSNEVAAMDVSEETEVSNETIDVSTQK